MELTKNRDWNFFRLEPPEGVLPPGEKVNVKFIFTPVKGRNTPYAQVIPLKIANNPKPINFNAKAIGYTLKLQFDPPLVDCGPILPAFEGQLPNERLLRLVNPSPYPIEVFNMDFDDEFNKQDQYLMEYPGFPEGDATLYLDPLKPGEPFWPHIVKEVDRKREMDAAAAEAAAAAASAEAGDGAAGVKAGEEHPPKDNDGNAEGKVKAQDEVGDLQPAEEAEPEALEDDSINLLVIGPPASGVSTQAHALARRYSLPLVTVDELIQSGIALADTPEEREQLTAMLPGPAPAEGVETPEPVPAGKKGTDALPEPLVPPGFLDNEDGAKLLAATIPRALADDVYAKGVVIDGGCSSSYVWNAGTVASEVLKAFGLARVNSDGPVDTPEALEAAAAAKVGKGGKGKVKPEDEVPELPFWWEGRKRVYVAQLEFSEADTLDRVKALLPQPQTPADPQDGAEPIDFVAEASALPDEAADMPPVPPPGEDSPGDDEVAAKDKQPKTLEAVDPDMHERIQEWAKRSADLQQVFGEQGESPGGERNRAVAYSTEAGKGADPASVTTAVIGIRFVHGNFTCVLPAVDEDR